MKKLKLNEQGWAHWLVPMLVIGIVAVIGVKVLNFSHANGILPPNNPSRSLVADPSINGYSNSLSSINNAQRILEGLGGMPLNLAAYESMSVPQQLFVATNLERIERGQRPIVALTAQLNSYAQTGANNNRDPVFPNWSSTGGNYLTGGTKVTATGGNLAWGNGFNNSLGAHYVWMYDDGGSSWGHRDNILVANDSCTNGNIYMGAATATLPAPTYHTYAEEFAVTCGVTPTDKVFTWAQAQAILSPPPASGNHWYPWDNIGGVTYSAPAAVSWGSGRIDVIARGTDNVIDHKAYQGGWYPWDSLGGGTYDAPAVSSWGAGRLDVFVRGTDNTIYHKAYAP